MIQYKIYSNSNILNIPRELYKAKDTNGALKTSTLLFGTNFRDSYKSSLKSYTGDRVASFAKFFASSINSLKDLVTDFTKEKDNSYFDFTLDYDESISSNNSFYFDPSNEPSDITSDLSKFVDDINNFLDESDNYANNNVSILNKQIENDLYSSSEDLRAFAIGISEDKRLELDKEELTSKLDDRDRLNQIATKSDSIFNKLKDRFEKIEDDPISKYARFVDDSKKNTNYNMFNYLDNSQKFALNSTPISGSIIDYLF